MPDMQPDALAERPPRKPLPRYCARCGQQAVWPASIPYQGQVRHEGRLHDLDPPRLNVPRCEACGEVYFDNWADDQIRLALREQLHLLGPDQLRMNR